MSDNFITEAKIAEAQRIARILIRAYPREPESRTPRASLIYNKRGGYTLEEIAEELGVTRERVRQIEQSALLKLKRWMSRNGFRVEDII